MRVVAAIVLVLAGGCAAEPAPRPAGGGGPKPGPVHAEADPLVARFKDYVYATYRVDAEGRQSEAALEKLAQARESLARAMEGAGLKGAEESLGSVVDQLRQYFLDRWDLIFVPTGAESGGVLLVKPTGREVRDAPARYKVVHYDGVLVEDYESWRRAAGGGPPARPVARAQAKTIFVDLGVARRLAREIVIPRAKAAEALEKRALAGDRLTPVDTKDLLRHRALSDEVRSGEDAVARAIAAEEERRLAALLSTAPEDARELASPDALAKIERAATLIAAASGDPRYHLASALSAMIAAPGTPQAAGASAALAVFRAKPLPQWTEPEMREAARKAVGAGK